MVHSGYKHHDIRMVVGPLSATRFDNRNSSLRHDRWLRSDRVLSGSGLEICGYVVNYLSFFVKLFDEGIVGIFLSNAGSGGCIPGILAYVGPSVPVTVN